MVTDNYGTPITNSTTCVVYIKRTSDGQFLKNDGTWQLTEVSIPMTKNFQCLYTYNFNIPTTPNNYICYAVDSVNKVNGSVVLESVDKLENLDRKVSDTLLAATYVQPDNTGIANLNSKITSARATNLDNIDMKISDVPTVGEIWSNTSRTLTPSNVQGVGAVSLSITLANDINVIVYNSLKQALYQGVSESGNITFNLNSGEYYIYYSKDGFYSKQEKLIIPNTTSYLHSVELSPIVGDTDLNIKVRELPSKSTVYKDEVLKIGIELFAEKDFSIMSATASSGTVEVVGKKVFSTVTFSTLGNMVIEFDVQVGNQTITHRVTKKVV